jgi:hypothetical protein
MAAFSDYAEDAVLDHVLGTAALTSPAAVYLALFITDPTDAGSGTEVSTGGYARQAITFNAAVGGVATSDADVSFTASGSAYGTVTHIGIYDAVSGGNLLVHTQLSASRLVSDGDTLTFSAGNVAFTLQ